MIDRDCFTSIMKVLSEVNADKQKDEFGTAHMLLFGDFKVSKGCTETHICVCVAFCCDIDIVSGTPSRWL